MKFVSCLTALSAGLVLVSAPYAHGRDAPLADCQEDAKVFCSDVQGKWVADCLQDHAKELSGNCSTVLEQYAGDKPKEDDGSTIPKDANGNVFVQPK